MFITLMTSYTAAVWCVIKLHHVCLNNLNLWRKVIKSKQSICLWGGRAPVGVPVGSCFHFIFTWVNFKEASPHCINGLSVLQGPDQGPSLTPQTPQTPQTRSLHLPVWLRPAGGSQRTGREVHPSHLISQLILTALFLSFITGVRI